jgi:cell wall-associated NlpC family hydrolase
MVSATVSATVGRLVRVLVPTVCVLPLIGVGAVLTAALAPVGAAGGLGPTGTLTPARGCARLTPGMNGIKVKMVQTRLGFPASTWETMDAATINAVRAFQRSVGFTADGVVGPETWRAMGFWEDFCFDRYQARIVVPVSAAPQERIEAMIAHARGYLGEEYVWGGAGPKGYGVDCSGMILQALYSAGLDPQPISVDEHVLPAYRTSLEFYRHPALAHAPLGDVRRGDLVFWRSRATGMVNHVALSLGGGEVIEAVEPAVHLAVIGNRATQVMMPEVVRPFPAPVDSAITRHWRAGGAAESALGAVISAEYAVAGGSAQDFAGGRIYWSPATGARTLRGPIAERAGTMDVTATPLGFPISDQGGSRDGGAYALFTGGKILWHQDTGAHAVWGAIEAAYSTAGAEWGPLGYPVDGEAATEIAGVVRQRFAGGEVTWSAATGPRVVTTAPA